MTATMTSRQEYAARYAANVRRIASRARKGFQGDSPYADSLTLLSNLEPGSTETATRVYRFLVKDAIQDLRDFGCIEPYMPKLLEELGEFIRVHGMETGFGFSRDGAA